MSEKVAQCHVSTAAFIGLGAVVHLHYMSSYLRVTDEGTRTLSPTQKLEKVSFLASLTPRTRLCQAGHTPWILPQKLAAQSSSIHKLHSSRGRGHGSGFHVQRSRLLDRCWEFWAQWWLDQLRAGLWALFLTAKPPVGAGVWSHPAESFFICAEAD